MSAADAYAVEFQFMGLDGEAVSSGDLFLESFDVFILEFHDLAAGRANEMIVMPLVGHIIVLRLCAEMTGLGQAHVAKEIEGSVNCGQSYMWIFFSELPIHLLGGNVLIL